MIYHKLAKSILYKEIKEYMPKEEIQKLIDKYEMQIATAKSKADREIATILVRRYKDLLSQ